MFVVSSGLLGMLSRMIFEPLWQRLRPDANYSGPFPGIPSWMEAGFASWLHRNLTPGRVAQWDRLSRQRRPLGGSYRPVDEAVKRALSDAEYGLGLADYLLSLDLREDQYEPFERQAVALANVLHTAGSEWLVAERAEGGGYMLEQREPVETSAVLADARSVNVKVAEQLEAARAALFGRQVDPNVAYDAVVRALEVAMHAVVSPNDSAATMGKMNAAIRQASPEKFAFLLDGAPNAQSARDVVLPLSEAVWKTQRRHGTDQRDPVTLPQAQAAYLAGVALCGWFLSGAIRNTEQP